MRVGINLPLRNAAGVPLTGAEALERTRWIEESGLDGVWMGDNLGFGRPNPLMWLEMAAAGSTNLEIGTCVLIIPQRNPAELAQAALTLENIAPGRISLGVGAGSTRPPGDEGAFENRFKVLHENMAKIRELRDVHVDLRGPSTAGQDQGHRPQGPRVRWAPLANGPRFILGAWHSEISLKRAVREYDGWMCSAGRTNYNTMNEAMKMFRDLGGKRAMVSTCLTDLRATSKPQTDDDSFYLQCSPEEARERLGRIAELGFDDILLVKANQAAPRPLYEPDFTFEDLQELRSLVPKDAKTAWS